MLYRGLLLLHLLGVVAFFANAVAALFWQRRASRSGDPVVIAHTFRTLDAGDRWLTPVAVALIVASGIGLARILRLPLLGTGWILGSIAAFSLSGIVFATRVLPLQRRLAIWTTECAAADARFDRERYAREARRWSLWADLSLGLGLAAFVFMVVRPTLPAP